MGAALPTPKQKNRKRLVIVAASIVLLWIPFAACFVTSFIHGFVDYTQRANATEAPFELHNIALLEQRWCMEHGDYLGPAGPVPARPGRHRQHGDFSSDPTFARLGFAPAEPRYYSYSIGHDSTGAPGIEIFAHGDLDGDGALSSISLTCGVGCRCETGFYILNEFE